MSSRGQEANPNPNPKSDVRNDPLPINTNGDAITLKKGTAAMERWQLFSTG
jgi:hypothetical protein